MTKITKILTALFAMFATMAWADSRSPQEMLNIAQKKLGTNVSLAPTGVSGAKGKTVSGTKAYTTYNASNGKGFVIVGADDRLPEIIGYSLEGSFSEDDMAPALKAALENLTDRLPYMTATVQPKVTYTPVEPLLTTLWNQNSPYNDNCPVITLGDGTTYTCATGCVATALAQVINYWGQKGRFPAVGEGSVTWSSTSSLSASKILTYDFTQPLDFANMKDYYGKTCINNDTVNYAYTKEEGAAVARLMQTCGAITKQNYGVASSSMLTYLDYLVEHYPFGVGSCMLNSGYYTNAEWMQIINEQLLKGYPLPYAGYTPTAKEGHAFVIDGIDSEGNVHVNWGWAGKSNGHFNILSLYPSSQGIGGSSTNQSFNYRTKLIVDLAPDEMTPVSCYRSLYVDFDVEKQSFVFKGFTTISHARKADMAIVATNSETAKTDTLIISDEDKDKILPKVISAVDYPVDPFFSYAATDFTNVSDGKYALHAITRDPGQQGWSIVRTLIERGPTVNVTVKDGKVVSVEGNDVPEPEITGSIRMINADSLSRPGITRQFEVTLHNTGNVDVIDNCLYYCIIESDGNETSRQGPGFSIAAGETRTYTFSTFPYKEGKNKMVMYMLSPLDRVRCITDTLEFVTIEPIAKKKDFLVSYPINMAKEYVLTKDFDVNVRATSGTTMDSLYVYFSMINTSGKTIYKDSVLYKDVKPDDDLSCRFSVPVELLSAGMYKFTVLLGNKEKNDIMNNNDGYQVLMYEAGKKYPAKIVAKRYYGEDSESLDMEHPGIEEVSDQEVFILKNADDSYTFTFPEQAYKKLDFQALQLYCPNVASLDYKHETMKVVCIDGDNIDCADIKFTKLKCDNDVFEISYTYELFNNVTSFCYLGKFEYNYTIDMGATAVSSVKDVDRSRVSGKYIRDGRLVIVRNNKEYNAIGERIK